VASPPAPGVDPTATTSTVPPTSAPSGTVPDQTAECG
jgi:hypothetical protein